MRILFYASHLLHHRSLIPVMIELSRRGHAIVIQTTRPDCLGMPTYQMNWRPTKVTGINRTSLNWLAGKMGYGEEWQQASGGWQLGMREAKADQYVTTTKDMGWLWGQSPNGGRFAVGYQHIPVICETSFISGWIYAPSEGGLPNPFVRPHAFAVSHEFGRLFEGCSVSRCGFPHLDKTPVDLEVPRPTVLVQHSGGHRGITGHRWMIDVCREAVEAGYDAAISAHWIPGVGYDDISLHYAMKAKFPWSTGYWFTPDWRSVAGGCSLILTTGSSAAYEMWAVGLTNVFVLGYVGGQRQEKFRLFPDLTIESPEALRKLLKGLPRSAQATEPLTRTVMEAYQSIHTGQGAKMAADVIEGRQ